ncbi:hypothetical protein Lal_00001989 [Lupinus albus]|nr:hypothetical protein Lal_00001989 [Lupinus albus]
MVAISLRSDQGYRDYLSRPFEDLSRLSQREEMTESKELVSFLFLKKKPIIEEEVPPLSIEDEGWNDELAEFALPTLEVEKNSPKASNSKRLTIANVRPEKSNRIPNQSYVGPDFSAKRSSLPSLPT